MHELFAVVMIFALSLPLLTHETLATTTKRFLKAVRAGFKDHAVAMRDMDYFEMVMGCRSGPCP